MVQQLSNEPRYKLQAVLNNELAFPTAYVTAEYLRACQDWFEALSAQDWLVATEVVRTFYEGDEAGAQNAAHALPPAPFPV